MQPGEAVSIVAAQRSFYESGATREVAWRVEQLKLLRNTVSDHRHEIVAALKEDLGRPVYEAYVADVATTLMNAEQAIYRLREWSRPRRAHTPSYLFPAISMVVAEPLGVALIIGPWNYPMELVLSPLIAAMAAGNCAVLKPSELAPATSAVVTRMMSETFDPSYVKVVEGGPEVSRELLEQTFDHILYTGSSIIGKLVMEAAAKNLTPVTLELGGKSPCIVEPDAMSKACARRIAWGKYFNAGQTCIAPDYLLVHRSVKDELLSRMADIIRDFYGPDPKSSPDFGRIVNERHFDRLSALLEGDIVVGGDTDMDSLYIAPTVIDNVTEDHPAMAEEIFGPILPVIAYDSLDEALELVRRRPKPLAFYLFTRDREVQRRVLAGTTSGGVCVNDTMVYYSNTSLPFGGVGMSGFGRYHGRFGFETFSNPRAVMKRTNLFDIYLRYPPYIKASGLIHRIIRFIT
jgi:acyl-CoA reductase-like NAD-dependent aldehyde dehydrogenase